MTDRVGATPIRPRNEDLLPWYDQLDWFNDPQLAYLKGLQDGYLLRDGDLMAEWETAYAHAFPHVNGKTRIESHYEVLAARRRRAETDAPGQREGDYPGEIAA